MVDEAGTGCSGGGEPVVQVGADGSRFWVHQPDEAGHSVWLAPEGETSLGTPSFFVDSNSVEVEFFAEFACSTIEPIRVNSGGNLRWVGILREFCIVSDSEFFSL